MRSSMCIPIDTYVHAHKHENKNLVILSFTSPSTEVTPSGTALQCPMITCPVIRHETTSDLRATTFLLTTLGTCGFCGPAPPHSPAGGKAGWNFVNKCVWDPLFLNLMQQRGLVLWKSHEQEPWGWEAVGALNPASHQSPGSSENRHVCCTSTAACLWPWGAGLTGGPSQTHGSSWALPWHNSCFQKRFPFSA